MVKFSDLNTDDRIYLINILQDRLFDNSVFLEKAREIDSSFHNKEKYFECFSMAILDVHHSIMVVAQENESIDSMLEVLKGKIKRL